MARSMASCFSATVDMSVRLPDLINLFTHFFYALFSNAASFTVRAEVVDVCFDTLLHKTSESDVQVYVLAQIVECFAQANEAAQLKAEIGAVVKKYCNATTADYRACPPEYLVDDFHRVSLFRFYERQRALWRRGRPLSA
jgi:hypothetical protein